MAYTKTTWIDGQSPGISAANLNKIENELVNIHNIMPRVKVEESVYLNNTSEKLLGSIDNNYKVLYVTLTLYQNDDTTNPVSTMLGETYTIYPNLRGRYILIKMYQPDTKAVASVPVVLALTTNQFFITPPSAFVGLYAKLTWVYTEV